MLQKTKKIFKVSLFLLIILPILVFLGFAAAVSFIDFNRYKPQIEEQVKTLTQRDFKIEGAIDVSVIPFAMTIGQSSLANSKSFTEQEPLLQFKTLRAELSLLELFLHKRLDVKSVEWIEPNLVLATNQLGENNWQDLPGVESVLQSLFDAQVSQSPQSAQSSSGLELSAENWQLDSLVIQGGQVSWDSAATENNWQLSNISIVANQLAMDQAFAAHTMFDWHQPAAKRSIKWRTNAEITLPTGWDTIEVHSWQGVLKSNLLEQSVYPVVNITQKGKDFRYQWQKSDLHLGSWELRALNGQLMWSASGNLKSQVSGQVSAIGVQYQEWSKQLALPLPPKLITEKLTDEDALFDWRYQAGQWQVDRVTKQGSALIVE